MASISRRKFAFGSSGAFPPQFNCGGSKAAHHYYKVARQAGAQDADLQNVTALTSQLSEADPSPLAIETVWQAPRE